MFIIYQLELLFFIVTTILYILVLVCVYQEWKSKNTLVNISFFQLFFITGIIDLCKFLNSVTKPNLYTVILHHFH